jgi:DNA repair protein RadD
MADFTGEDRQESILALNRCLKPYDIRSLIPSDLSRLVRAVERCGIGNGLYDPRVPDNQAAAFLLDLHGGELLRDRAVRVMLVRNASDQAVTQLYEYDDPIPARGRNEAENAVVMRNWHPGKSWARFFVRTLGLPGALAGSPDGGEAPSSEVIEPYVPLPALHEFQQTLAQDMFSILHGAAGENRAILSLPTGAGKTRTAVEAIVRAIRGNRLPGRFVLWIAQSDELCEQAISAFREVWTDQCVRSAMTHPAQQQRSLRLFRLWASREIPDPLDTGVVIASIQKLKALSSREDPNLLALLNATGPVIVDEAHHAVAQSYTHIFRLLGLGGRRNDSDRAIVGLTATPFRGTREESEQLVRRFYSRLLIPKSDNLVEDLRASGVLARMQTSTVSTGRSFTLSDRELKEVEKFHELPDSALNKIGSDRERNRLILDELSKIEASWPVLFFGCSVRHAQAIALLLRRAGRSAAVITGETPASLRREWISDFRAGTLQFLCNYGVLTTGFDAPQIRVVVVARPTASPLLYEQMIGRGMRGPRNGGKEECLVIDMVDVIPGFGEPMSYRRYADLWAKRPTRSGGVQSDGQGDGQPLKPGH